MRWATSTVPRRRNRQTIATSFADLIVGVACEIDGKAVKQMDRYRFLSDQFTFTAPTPWIFGDVGGTGTSVADGYYVMVRPLSVGSHTIHFSGAFDFGTDGLLPLDVTYNIQVTPPRTLRPGLRAILSNSRTLLTRKSTLLPVVSPAGEVAFEFG